MAGPAWLRSMLAALMIAIALYHAIRLVTSRRIGRAVQYDVDLTHLAISIFMATMLVVDLSGRWALVFAVPALWFARRGMHVYVFDGVRPAMPYSAPMLGCVAMLYLPLAMPGLPGGHPGAQSGVSTMAMPAMADSASAPTRWPVVAVLLIAGLVLVAAWHAVPIWRVAIARPSGGSHVAAGPVLTGGCQLAMSATMIYMLAAAL